MLKTACGVIAVDCLRINRKQGLAFNVCGNNDRMTVLASLQAKALVVHRVMTHAEYSNDHRQDTI